VNALEHDLQVPLFHRHAHGLVVTGQGELLLLRAAREVTGFGGPAHHDEGSALPKSVESGNLRRNKAVIRGISVYSGDDPNSQGGNYDNTHNGIGAEPAVRSMTHAVTPALDCYLVFPKAMKNAARCVGFPTSWRRARKGGQIEQRPNQAYSCQLHLH
jgi:hypothetical protein